AARRAHHRRPAPNRRRRRNYPGEHEPALGGQLYVGRTTTVLAERSARALSASSHRTSALVTSSGRSPPVAMRPSTSGITARALTLLVRKVIPRVYMSSSGRGVSGVK